MGKLTFYSGGDMSMYFVLQALTPRYFQGWFLMVSRCDGSVYTSSVPSGPCRLKTLPEKLPSRNYCRRSGSSAIHSNDGMAVYDLMLPKGPIALNY